MKQKIFFLLFCLASFRASAQTIVDPADFPVMSSPTLSNWAIYTREDHVNRKVLPTAIRALMLPIVRQPADITYTPAATGNANDKGSFVKTPTGRVYFIDGLGNSIQSNFPYAAATIADNDVHAGVMCVPVGGWYRLSNSNTLGLPPGTLRQRVFGTLTPCTNAANPISPGQTAVVGGSGILKVNGDPDTNPYVKAQGQHYESSIAYDTLHKKVYTYDFAGSVGNRWNVFEGVSVDTRVDTAYIQNDTLKMLVLDVGEDTIQKTINVALVFPTVTETGLVSPLPSVGRPGSVVIKTIDINNNVALYFSDGSDWLGPYEIPGVKNVDSLMLGPKQVYGLHLAQSGATTGQVYKWNGTAWAPATDGGADGNGIYSGSGNISEYTTVTIDPANELLFTDGNFKIQINSDEPRYFIGNSDEQAGVIFNPGSGLNFNVSGSNVFQLNATADAQFSVGLNDNALFKIADNKTVQTGLEYNDEYLPILTNDRSIPDVGLVKELITDSLATISSDALGTGFVDGGGTGIIPTGTIAKTEEFGTFQINYFTTNTPALVVNDDEGSIFLYSPTGVGSFLFDNNDVYTTGDQVNINTTSGSFSTIGNSVEISANDDISFSANGDITFFDPVTLDGGDGSDAKHVLLKSSDAFGGTTELYGNDEGSIALEYNNSGSGVTTGVKFSASEMVYSANDGTALTYLSMTPLATTFTDGATTKKGMQYAGDYSTTIKANARSIPDVGTVRQIIADSVGNSGHIIRDEGSNLTARPYLNFTGAAATAADNSGTNATDVSFDADLNAIAAISTTNGVLRKTAANTWALFAQTFFDDSTFYRVTGKAIAGFAGKRPDQKIWKQGNLILGKNLLTNTTTLDTSGTLVLYPRGAADGGAQAAIKVVSTDTDVPVDFGNNNMLLKAGLLNIESQTGTYQTNQYAGFDTWSWRSNSSPNEVQFYNETDFTNPFNISTAAASNSFRIDASSNIFLGNASTGAKLNIINSTSATGGIVGLENSGGLNRMFRSAASPETVISANAGDLVLTPIGIYSKNTASSNTGYSKLSGTIFTQTADKTVSNTTTQTSILGTGVGITTLPSGFLIAGRTIRLKVSGLYSTVATPGNVIVRVKLGSTVIASATTSGFVTGASSDYFDFETTITCRTTGGSGTVMSNGIVSYAGASGPVFDAVNNGGSTATVATNTSQALNVTVEWDTADAGKIIKTTTCVIEVLN